MALLTPTTWKFLETGYEYSRWIHFHPFVWDREERTVQLITYGVRLLPWYFNMTLTFAYYAFVVFRSIQTNKREDADTLEKIYMQFNVAYFMFPVIFQLSILSSRAEFRRFVHKYLHFLKEYQEIYLRDKKASKWSRLCGQIMGFVYYSFYLNEALVICCSYFRPHSPELLSSLLPDPQSLLWYQRIPFVLLHLYIMTGFVEAAVMFIFGSIGFVVPAMDLIDILRNSSKIGKNLLTDSHIKKLRERLNLFLAIQSLVGEYNDVIGRIFMGCKILLVFMSIFCTYGGIRFHGLLAICLGWIGCSTTAFLIIMLSSLGEFHNKSKKLLLLWKKQTALMSVHTQDVQRATWLRKQIRSMREIQIRFGSLYIIDKPIVLTCFKIIFDAVTNFLILNK